MTLAGGILNTSNNYNNHCHSISSDFPTLAKYSILVVEDETLERELLTTQLTEWELDVKAAEDGRKALSLLKEDDAIRLLITDMQMPNLGGLGLLREIKNLARPKLYSIVLSGIRDRQTMINALKAGATDYMVKPYHPEQIFARLAVLDQIMALEEGYQALVRALFDVMGDMLGSRDIYSLDHSLRVAAISRRIGLHLGLSLEELKTLEMGCLVHDIGKVAIPDDILLKPGCFNYVDRQIMQMHPTIGAKFLDGRYPDDRITEIILHHHERLDGSGYPSGLKGDDIGLMVRIVSVADVYEALIAKRPYKAAMTSTQAIEELRDEAREGRLDKSVVEVLGKIVASWDPLTIQRHPYKEIDLLESFRQTAYFREPLCSFYNYRYLLTLDKTFDLTVCGPEYYMILIKFMDLEQINRKWGYLKVDQILDEIGEDLQRSINDFARGCNEIEGEALLFRMGTDYLIFVSYPLDFLGELSGQIRIHLDTYKSQWGLETQSFFESFPSSCSIEHSLNQFLKTVAASP